MKNIIKQISLFALILLSGYSYANTGKVYIENVQIIGSTFSWEVHFERTGEWTGTLLKNALGSSVASFDFNNLGLENPVVLVEPGGALDNTNYVVSANQIIDKCIIDIQFSLTALVGVLPLNIKTKLFTVSMNIANSSLTASLAWDELNTGFFDNSDQNVNTMLEGGSNNPLPVELTSFAAVIKNNSVTLNWKTATEINNYGFEVERMANNSNWSKIGFVSGSGNSNSPKDYSFTDNNLFGGGNKFYYRLRQVDNDGQHEYSDIVEAEVIPQQLELSQNYPNPFNPVTTIRFSLPVQTQLKINIYNMIGELVKTVSEGLYEAGFYSISFDASQLSSGTYIYRLESDYLVQSKKMILLK